MMITKMCECHVAQVAELEKICFSDPWSEKSVASELNNPLALWLVAEEDGVVLGYIGSQSVPPESDVMNVAVHPEHRRKGIAQLLILALCDALKVAGNTSLTLEVRASNTPAIALYERFGFAVDGIRKNYYKNPTENAVLMTLSLQE